MKKFLFVVLFLLLNNRSQAQVVFCPPGAEWRYNFWYDLSGYISNEKITYSYDTIIGTDTVKVLRHDSFFMHDNTYAFNSWIFNLRTFIKQKGDTIFMKNKMTLNTWQILYNFNCQVGQWWNIAIYSNPNSVVHHHFEVDSLGFVTLNNMPLKRLCLSLTTDLNGWGMPALPLHVTERLGSQNFLFNYFHSDLWSDHDHILQFLCYKDNTFGLKQLTPYPCEMSGRLGIDESQSSQNQLQVYPNPSKGSIHIRWNEAVDDLKIMDLFGNVVYSDERPPLEEPIVIGTLAAGIYFIRVQTAGVLQTIKFVKE